MITKLQYFQTFVIVVLMVCNITQGCAVREGWTRENELLQQSRDGLARESELRQMLQRCNDKL